MVFNESITIQKVTETRSTTGSVTAAWTTHDTCYSNVEQVTGNEQFTSDMMVYNDIKRFTIYYTNGNDVTPKMRISYDGGIYYITSVAHTNRLHTTLIAIRNDDE
jgi:SPP1 family predicted phage head-tail adaptor